MRTHSELKAERGGNISSCPYVSAHRIDLVGSKRCCVCLFIRKSTVEGIVGRSPSQKEVLGARVKKPRDITYQMQLALVEA